MPMAPPRKAESILDSQQKFRDFCLELADEARWILPQVRTNYQAEEFMSVEDMADTLELGMESIEFLHWEGRVEVREREESVWKHLMYRMRNERP